VEDRPYIRWPADNIVDVSWTVERRQLQGLLEIGLRQTEFGPTGLKNSTFHRVREWQTALREEPLARVSLDALPH